MHAVCSGMCTDGKPYYKSYGQLEYFWLHSHEKLCYCLLVPVHFSIVPGTDITEGSAISLDILFEDGFSIIWEWCSV